MALILSGIRHAYAAGTDFAQASLDGVSLHVEPGGLALVVGPTGSGKSTLLRIAAGLLPATGGTVTLDGDAVTRPRDARGRAGMVFQRPEAQFFAATVLEDVAFGPRNLGAPADESAAAARDALALVGLDADAFGPRSPFTLSGGEARRVALAGVAAMGPAYLLLDEPTAGLDAAGRASVAAAVAAARSRAGIVIVTHDADEFLSGADSVLALDAGRVAFAGTPAEMLAALAADPDALECPSQVVRAQLLAADRAGVAPGELTFSVTGAAAAIAAMAGAGS